MVEALPGEKVLVKFVLLSSDVLREGLRSAQHLTNTHHSGQSHHKFYNLSLEYLYNYLLKEKFRPQICLTVVFRININIIHRKINK